MIDIGRTSVLTLIGACLALLMQILGYVTPGWLYIRVDYVTLHYGLWYLVFCQHSSCTTHSTVDGDFLDDISSSGSSMLRASMVLYQILTTLGVISCLVAMVLLVRNRLASQPNETFRKLAIFSLVASGAFAIGASAKYGSGIVSAVNLFNTFNIPHPYMFPYSLFLTGLGGIFAVIVFFSMVCKCSQQSDNRTPTNQQGIVMSPYTVGKA